MFLNVPLVILKDSVTVRSITNLVVEVQVELDSETHSALVTAELLGYI